MPLGPDAWRKKPQASDHDRCDIAQTLASQANVYDCYEAAVQTPAKEVLNLLGIYGRLAPAGSPPARILREDFCGSAALCRAWLQRHVLNEAHGVDLDPVVLTEARTRSPGLDRLHLYQEDVSQPDSKSPPADIIVALNYGICYFHTYSLLVAYLRHCRARLSSHGLFFCDFFGGSIYHETESETRRLLPGGVRYTFSQSRINMATNGVQCAISFRFADGSALKRAFTYDFRMWSIAEIRDAMIEAGFSNIHLYLSSVEDQAGPDAEDSNVVSADFEHYNLSLRHSKTRLPELPPIRSWNATMVGR